MDFRMTPTRFDVQRSRELDRGNKRMTDTFDPSDFDLISQTPSNVTTPKRATNDDQFMWWDEIEQIQKEMNRKKRTTNGPQVKVAESDFGERTVQSHGAEGLFDDLQSFQSVSRTMEPKSKCSRYHSSKDMIIENLQKQIDLLKERLPPNNSHLDTDTEQMHERLRILEEERNLRDREIDILKREIDALRETLTLERKQRRLMEANQERNDHEHSTFSTTNTGRFSKRQSQHDSEDMEDVTKDHTTITMNASSQSSGERESQLSSPETKSVLTVADYTHHATSRIAESATNEKQTKRSSLNEKARRMLADLADTQPASNPSIDDDAASLVSLKRQLEESVRTRLGTMQASTDGSSPDVLQQLSVQAVKQLLLEKGDVSAEHLDLRSSFGLLTRLQKELQGLIHNSSSNGSIRSQSQPVDMRSVRDRIESRKASKPLSLADKIDAKFKEMEFKEYMRTRGRRARNRVW